MAYPRGCAFGLARDWWHNRCAVRNESLEPQDKAQDIQIWSTPALVAPDSTPLLFIIQMKDPVNP